jgi:LemA protein
MIQLTALMVLITLGAIVLWVIVRYNALIRLRNQVENGWKQIDVQLKRRHDLIPNLVSTVKGIMEFEQDTLEKVVSARSAAMGAKGVADSAAKEGMLTDALSKFFVVVEQYPQLRSSENVRQLQEELTSTENKIAFSRQFYNDIATEFNIAQQVFPANIIASAFNFKLAELFEITVAAEREVPAVNLSLKK